MLPFLIFSSWRVQLALIVLLWADHQLLVPRSAFVTMI
jgi:hypothetical protein